MGVHRIKEAATFSRRLLLAVLCLALMMSVLVTVAQTLRAHALDAQVVPQSNSFRDQNISRADGWVRVAPVGEEFTVLMPGRPTMKTDTGTNGRDVVVHLYRMNTDDAMYIVTSSPKQGAGDASAMLDPLTGEYEQPFFKERRRQGGEVTVIEKRDLTLNGFSGREYQLSLGDTPCVTRVFVTRRKIYTLIWLYFELADLPGPTHEDRFLKSFTLGPINRNVAASNVMHGDGRIGREIVRPPTIEIDRPLIIGPGRGGNTGGGDQSARGAQPNRPTGRIFSPREVTQKARLISKPEPQYTEQARQKNINGTVILSVVLAASGQVTNIRVVSGLPYGLNQKAIEAARRVQFTPATRDGHAVSQSALLEYNFNLY